jgi:uncharacterized coiled-coil DUF342 family protein
MSKPAESDMLSKIKSLQEQAQEKSSQVADLRSKQDQYRGRLAEKKAELARLLVEIKEAGLEPKDLKSKVEEGSEELRLLLEAFDRDIKIAEQAFSELEAKQ